MNKELSQEIQEQIEAYLLNQMSSEERLAFESRLKNDSKLAEEVRLFNSLMMSIEAREIQKTIAEVVQAKTAPSVKQDKKNTIGVYRILKFAIPLAAILTAVIYYFNVPNQSPSESLFAEYFEADPGLPTPMGSTAKQKFYDGMVDYKLGEYEKSVMKWEPLLTDLPSNDTLQYFMATALMNQSNFEKARPLYAQVALQKNSIFWVKSIWYQALILTQEGKTKEAKLLLNQLSDVQGDFQNKVISLQKELENR